MIFSRELTDKVMSGEKVMTRRKTHRDGRALRYKAGGVYAVQPGRGKPHVGHILVTHADTAPLWMLTIFDARAEGFDRIDDFWDYWMQLHGSLDIDELVTVIRFTLAPRCARCPSAIQT